jgi:hypothetical protein
MGIDVDLIGLNHENVPNIYLDGWIKETMHFFLSNIHIEDNRVPNKWMLFHFQLLIYLVQLGYMNVQMSRCLCSLYAKINFNCIQYFTIINIFLKSNNLYGWQTKI